MARVLLVDFDGVLAVLPVDWDAVRGALSSWVGSRVDSIRRLLVELWPSSRYWEASRIIERYELEAVPRARLLPGAREGLLEARGRGLRVYVASLQARAPLEAFLEAHGLHGMVDGVLSRELCPLKSCMALVAALLEGVGPGEVVLVDDSEANMADVGRVGARAVYAAPARGGPTLLDAVKGVAVE